MPSREFYRAQMLQFIEHMDPLYEQDKMVEVRHPRRARWLLAGAVLALAVALVWLVPQNRNDREEWNGGGVEVGSANQGSAHSDMNPPPSKEAQAVGTTGSHDDAAGEEDAAVLREIETITGANDAMALVGRRVDLHVDVQARANDHAFWIGSPDNRLLVVVARDNRNGAKRQAGVPASHGIEPVRNGQRAAISGVLRSIPIAEHRYGWDLTERDEQELHERKVYIHADTVTPEAGQ
jgi:hypothetical protein